jgi:hypothetical protein
MSGSHNLTKITHISAAMSWIDIGHFVIPFYMSQDHDANVKASAVYGENESLSRRSKTRDSQCHTGLSHSS